MKLSWSHAVLNVQDMDVMLEFYGNVLGFTITDRGPMGGPDSPEIVFMSQRHDEHHEMAMVQAREDCPTTSLNHLSFRVESFSDLKEMIRRLNSRSVDIMPISHGNTLSAYFKDPEKNGLEVFLDTPWHMQQPAAAIWDTTSNEAEALQFVEDSFKDQPTFVRREHSDMPYVNRRPGDKVS